MFRLLDYNSLNMFLKILNSLWLASIIPVEWKTDCLVPILKPDKDTNDSNSYRPIVLSSCVGKIFEQLLKQRLEFYIESNHILPSNQFGFRRGFSSRESLGHLFIDINMALSENKHVICVFLDIVGAFNNVNHSLLSSVLTSLALPEKIVARIHNFIHGRIVYVKQKIMNSLALAWHTLVSVKVVF